MIRGVIFDIDGTLLDSMPIWEHAGERYLLQRGITPEPNLSEILFPMSMEAGADYLISQYPLSANREEVLEGICQEVQQFYEKEAPFKPGAARLLKMLQEKQIPFAAATSSSRDCVTTALKRLGAADMFADILTCSEVGAGKEKPDIYLEAARRMGSFPGETLVFEDALHALETAKKAGFRTVGVYDPANTEQEQIRKTADLYLSTLEETELLRKCLRRKE